MSRCCCHPTLQRLSPLSPLLWQRRPQIMVPCLPHECARGASRLVLRSLLFFTLFGAPKQNPLNDRKEWYALTLGGCRFNDTHNNQMKNGFHVTVDVGEDALLGQSVWGGCLFVQGDGLNNKKAKTNIPCGLRWTQIDIFHSTTNQKTWDQ
jgi:hypothetical protein